MSTYAYKAMDATGRRRSGRMEASNLADLEARLASLGLDFIVGTALERPSVFGNTIPRRELIAFFFHLEQLVGAGVPVADALTDLRDSTAHARLREVLAAMVDGIAAGRTLSQAMDEHPLAFDRVAVGLVRAGETTGDLAAVLSGLVDTLKWRDELAAHTRRLLIYPAFLGLVALGLVGFMLLYLVPRLAGFMKTLGQSLPPQTEALVALGSFVTAQWPLLALLGVATGVGTVLALQRGTRSRARLDRLALRLPLIGEALHKMRVARFAVTFASLHAAGITVLDALDTAAAAIGDADFAAALAHARQRIAGGSTLADAFAADGLFPPLTVRMLRIGETTGRLDLALRKVGDFYAHDVRETALRAQTLIEPVLTVAVGLVVGWILLAVLDPIYELIGRIKP